MTISMSHHRITKYQTAFTDNKTEQHACSQTAQQHKVHWDKMQIPREGSQELLKPCPKGLPGRVAMCDKMPETAESEARMQAPGRTPSELTRASSRESLKISSRT